MTLTKKQLDEMLEKSKPLIKWLNENCNPHCVVTVFSDRATLSEEVATNITKEFIKD
jgi:hypothetical protein